MLITMVKLLISKFIYPYSNIKEELAAYAGKAMQLSFFSPTFFESLDHKSLKAIIDNEDITVASVHAPTIDIFETSKFLKMLATVRSVYEVDNVTVHPGAGNPLQALKLHEKYSSEIQNMGVNLAYENFDSSKRSKRWIQNANSIYRLNFAHCSLTYDTSHVPAGRNISNDLENFYAKLGIVHFSNISKEKEHRNHNPYSQGIHDLNAPLEFLLRRSYPGYLVIEYAPQFKQEALDDYDYLSCNFGSLL